MIDPHGSTRLDARYVQDDQARKALAAEAERMPSLLLNSAAAANAVMLGAGYFNPLQGYQDLADALAIADRMHTVDGLFWPVPILNITTDAAGIEPGDRVALRDPNLPGNPVLAVQTVAKVETADAAALAKIVQGVFGTQNPEHPGVANFNSLGNVLLSGPIDVLHFSYFERDFPDTFRTAGQIRDAIAERNWKTVVAFQTRNPMHRAHEELCKMAMAAVGADGVLIHMLLGKLKPGDIPAPVRDAAIRKMVELYFEPNTVMITGYGFDMLYAGPREAVLHAVFRQNSGCTHFIVGRDHAGVGSFYGPFDAQVIFHEKVPTGVLKIQIFEADNTAYSRKLQRVVMMRDAPDHTADDFVQLSGTKVRDMLAAGQELPVEFARPEVAHILRDYYQSQS